MMPSRRTPTSWIVEIAERSIDAYLQLEGEPSADLEGAKRKAVSRVLLQAETDLLQGAPLLDEASGSASVYTVEFRQYLSPPAQADAPPAYAAHTVYLASTIEKAVAWCKRNTGYAPHKSEKTWDFAVRKRTVDADLLGGGLMMVLDWNGEVTGWTV